VKLVEAHYEDGVLKPAQPLPLRAGERVGVIVVRRPDPQRWNLARLATTGSDEDRILAETGVREWLDHLDAKDRR
jgi:predicted DNA-binding antitoxin AbrB/MazE fold protein